MGNREFIINKFIISDITIRSIYSKYFKLFFIYNNNNSQYYFFSDGFRSFTQEYSNKKKFKLS